MKVHNNSNFSEKEIAGLKLLGVTVNKWRQRRIYLYQHPTIADHVVSVGVTFDSSMKVIAEETKTDWTVALSYADRGQTYVSE